MASFRIRLDLGQASRPLAYLRTAKPAAVVRALNRSAGSGRTLLVREVARNLALKSSTVRDQITIEKATSRNVVSRIAVKGTRIPLIQFNARGPEPSRGRGRGVTARLPGGAGRYPHAFITTVGIGGHRGVFERKGKSRLPIRELLGPSLPHVFIKYTPLAKDRMQEQFLKEITHEFRYAVQQAAARS